MGVWGVCGTGCMRRGRRLNTCGGGLRFLGGLICRRVYTCIRVGLEFILSSNTLLHTLTHRQERPFGC